MTAYAGTFTVADGTVIHHVEIASTENIVGQDLERTIVSLCAGWNIGFETV